MANIAVWHGNARDFERLVKALRHNCDCDLENPVSPPCSVHKMVTNQAILDHFAFVGGNIKHYLQGEFDPSAEWF